MDDIPTKLEHRLQVLLNRADVDHTAVQSTPGGGAVYARLIDALAATLHNLPLVDEKNGE